MFTTTYSIKRPKISNLWCTKCPGKLETPAPLLRATNAIWPNEARSFIKQERPQKKEPSPRTAPPLTPKKIYISVYLPSMSAQDAPLNPLNTLLTIISRTVYIARYLMHIQLYTTWSIEDRPKHLRISHLGINRLNMPASCQKVIHKDNYIFPTKSKKKNNPL